MQLINIQARETEGNNGMWHLYFGACGHLCCCTGHVLRQTIFRFMLSAGEYGCRSSTAVLNQCNFLGQLLEIVLLCLLVCMYLLLLFIYLWWTGDRISRCAYAYMNLVVPHGWRCNLSTLCVQYHKVKVRDYWGIVPLSLYKCHRGKRASGFF
jgi:hypothetical protein